MPTPELGLAILVLLLTPGPTNTLMLLSGADRGFAATLRLIPLELCAYLCTVIPLVLLAQGAAPFLDTLRPAIATLAGAWVLLLAMRLWRSPVRSVDSPLVTGRQVATTTLLNPKALIFGLVLLPDANPVAGLALFSSLVVLAAVFWTALGSHSPLCRTPQRQGTGLPVGLRRAAACWLALLSIGIVVKGFA